MQRAPHILVISHNVLSKTTAMGKTLSSMLSCVPAENLAQLYFHSEIPTTDQCQNYFRIRDQDVLLSIFKRHIDATIYDKNDIQADTLSPRTDKGVISKIYQFSRRRTPLIYIMRNLVWRIGKWDSEELRNWLDNFKPDLIFFASGDYAFSYRIAYSISCRLKIPIVMWCCDDFYFSKRYATSIGGRYCHNNLLLWVKRITERVESVIVIGEKMKHDYATIFSVPINVIRISAPENSMAKPFNERTGIVYVGGLGVNRIDSLVELGRQLRHANLTGYECINVYSNDKNHNILKQLSEENGIHFCGGLAAETVPAVLGKAKFVLHVEAFDRKAKERTRYSVSTKIGESLRSGACMIAYGPSDIASIEYLEEYKVAAILHSPEEISNVIAKIISNPGIYKSYVDNAEQLAEKNHSKEKNDAMMSGILHLS